MPRSAPILTVVHSEFGLDTKDLQREYLWLRYTTITPLAVAVLDIATHSYR